MCMNKIFIMKRLLRKLVNLNMWGGKHTELLNLKKCIPKHLRGTKDTDKAIKELIQNFFILTKKSTGEIHVSLNSEKKKEIHEFLIK